VNALTPEVDGARRRDIRVHFEGFLPQGSGWNVTAACIQPLYNVLIAPAEVILTVDLPYVNENGVKLTCPTNDCVEIYAEASKKITFQDLGVRHRHGEFSCYHARIQIPVQVDEGKIRTTFKRGILEVRIPRIK